MCLAAHRLHLTVVAGCIESLEVETEDIQGVCTPIYLNPSKLRITLTGIHVLLKLEKTTGSRSGELNTVCVPHHYSGLSFGFLVLKSSNS